MTYRWYLLAQTIIFMFAGHAICDFPLQGDFLAIGKNPFLASNHGFGWKKCLFAHCIMHCAMVLWILQYHTPYQVALFCALMELVIHWCTDYAKCAGKISGNLDQAIHYTCKLLWASTIVIYYF